MLTIRRKYGIVLTIIFIVSIIVSNISLNRFFYKNFKDYITEDMKKNYQVAINSLDDYLEINNIYKNKMTVDNLNDKVMNFILNRVYCQGAIYDLNGKMLLSGTTNEKEVDLSLYEISEESLNIAKNNKTVVEIERRSNGIVGKLSYSIYGKGEQPVGIMLLAKNYEDEYIRNQNIKRLVNYIVIGLFAIILIAIYFLSSRIVNPLVLLKNKVVEVTKGNYPSKISIKSNDEVGVLVESFNLMSHKLRKKDEQEKNIFRNITHELKSPITSISGYAQILSEDNLDDEEFKKKAITRIIFECKRMNELVGTLLDISKQMSDLEDYNYDDVNLKNILNDIIPTHLPKIDKKSLEIIKEIDDISIKGNKQYLSILLNNLIENAIKYSDISTKVLIKLENKGKYKAFSIESEGKVIPPEMKEKIFDPFIRIEGKGTNKKNSHGLGLYICKNIVEAHNGNIKVEIDGKKTNFIVELSNINTLETF